MKRDARNDPGVVAFLRRESDLCVSVILFEELSFGLDGRRRSDATG